MSFENLSPADIQAVTGNNDGFGNGNGWWIILLFLLWGCGGWGDQGGGNSVKDAYVLSSDFATIQRQLSDGFNGIDNALDRQNAGICDLGYTQAQLINQTNMNLMQGNNALQAQLADCCCKTQSNIERSITQGVQNTGVITNAIKDCCCGAEKQFMQSRFDAAQMNCGTLQAIDKLGDRIIGYMANSKEQAMRDEIQGLRLAASQAAQNQYLINQLRPAPVPAFQVPGPYYLAGCNCGQQYA